MKKNERESLLRQGLPGSRGTVTVNPKAPRAGAAFDECAFHAFVMEVNRVPGINITRGENTTGRGCKYRVYKGTQEFASVFISTGSWANRYPGFGLGNPTLKAFGAVPADFAPTVKQGSKAYWYSVRWNTLAAALARAVIPAQAEEVIAAWNLE